MASEKSISLGTLRRFPQDLSVYPDNLLISPFDVATDEFGDLAVLYFDMAAEYFDIPDLLEPSDPKAKRLSYVGFYVFWYNVQS